jgi:hypothetical protein
MDGVMFGCRNERFFISKTTLKLLPVSFNAVRQSLSCAQNKIKIKSSTILVIVGHVSVNG